MFFSLFRLFILHFFPHLLPLQQFARLSPCPRAHAPALSALIVVMGKSSLLRLVGLVKAPR